MRNGVCPNCGSTDTRANYGMGRYLIIGIIIFGIIYYSYHGVDWTAIALVIVASAVFSNPGSICNACGYHYH